MVDFGIPLGTSEVHEGFVVKDESKVGVAVELVGSQAAEEQIPG
jgi:hypothetical protein